MAFLGTTFLSDKCVNHSENFCSFKGLIERNSKKNFSFSSFLYITKTRQLGISVFLDKTKNLYTFKITTNWCCS